MKPINATHPFCLESLFSSIQTVADLEGVIQSIVSAINQRLPPNAGITLAARNTMREDRNQLVVEIMQRSVPKLPEEKST